MAYICDLSHEYKSSLFSEITQAHQCLVDVACDLLRDVCFAPLEMLVQSLYAFLFVVVHSLEPS